MDSPPLRQIESNAVDEGGDQLESERLLEEEQLVNEDHAEQPQSSNNDTTLKLLTLSHTMQRKRYRWQSKDESGLAKTIPGIFYWRPRIYRDGYESSDGAFESTSMTEDIAWSFIPAWWLASLGMTYGAYINIARNDMVGWKTILQIYNVSGIALFIHSKLTGIISVYQMIR